MSGPGMSGSKRGMARRDELLAVATELFFQRGFHSVTVEHVADEAGASKQTIYRYFSSRDGLIEEVLRNALEEAVRPLELAASEASGDRLTRVGEAYQEMTFDETYLRVFRFIVGAANVDLRLGHLFNELVIDRVVGIVEPVVADAIGVRRALAETDAFLGALQGKEFNRVLAGRLPRETRLVELLGMAVAALLPQSSS